MVFGGRQFGLFFHSARLFFSWLKLFYTRLPLHLAPSNIEYLTIFSGWVNCSAAHHFALSSTALCYSLSKALRSQRRPSRSNQPTTPEPEYRKTSLTRDFTTTIILLSFLSTYFYPTPFSAT